MESKEMCNDNRFELIEKYKQKLIEATNIETIKDEMAVLDDVLFRLWQMKWLDKLEKYDRQQAEIEKLKDDLLESNIEIAELYKCKFSAEDVAQNIVIAKTEAYKEFVELLCEDRASNDNTVILAKCLLKELTEKGGSSDA